MTSKRKAEKRSAAFKSRVLARIGTAGARWIGSGGHVLALFERRSLALSSGPHAVHGP
jgi:hypothetical protein